MFANNFMPAVHGELGSNDRRAAPISFLKDFEEIVAGGGVERLQTPVIVCGRPPMASTF
jgi:hypothetical protein